jgi:uncharacterized membrane protein
MNNQDEINHKEWSNDDNWTMPIGFYFSKRDSRWIVGRKIGWMGWTFNIGNQIGAWATLLSLLIPTLIFVIILIFASNIK